MSRPFHILKHEHRIIERVLRALDGVCMRLEGGNKVPAAALREIVDFITEFADRYHHGKEETLLFPALERHGITREGGPLGVMEYEHQVERELIANLEQAIGLYQEGNADASQNFADAARTYLRMLVGHIEKEDSILFRIGDEVLDDEEKTALAASFKQTAAVLGIRSLEGYERLATELEDKWAL
jgi:hemerythrin-like domain-containing protein